MNHESIYHKIRSSDGILEKDAEECDRFPGMIRTDDGAHFHGEGKDWTRTKEAAAARAEEMKAKKIKSLKKQIEKLERMKFE